MDEPSCLAALVTDLTRAPKMRPMTDSTAKRSAGNPQAMGYDPTRGLEDQASSEARRDPTAGAPASLLYDPTRGLEDQAPFEARRDPTASTSAIRRRDRPGWSRAARAAAPGLPDAVRELLEAPNYVHLATLRADGSPRSCVVWVGLEGDHILVCTSDTEWKAKDMRRDPRVALSVRDMANPYRMAAIQGRVVEVRPDEGCRYLDPISIKYTGAPFPSHGGSGRGPNRLCFVITAEKAAQITHGFVHNPG
jgi:PPOX class probable F420-dependent enzyme